VNGSSPTLAFPVNSSSPTLALPVNGEGMMFPFPMVCVALILFPTVYLEPLLSPPVHGGIKGGINSKKEKSVVKLTSHKEIEFQLENKSV